MIFSPFLDRPFFSGTVLSVHNYENKNHTNGPVDSTDKNIPSGLSPSKYTIWFLLNRFIVSTVYTSHRNTWSRLRKNGNIMMRPENMSCAI